MPNPHNRTKHGWATHAMPKVVPITKSSHNFWNYVSERERETKPKDPKRLSSLCEFA